MRILLIISITLSSYLPFAALAQVQERTATIRGKSEVVVTKQKVILSDIAEISANDPEAQLAISKIDLINSPKPGATIEVPAQKIIDTLQAQGIDLKKVGYILSPQVKIRRAARAISEAEIEAALQAAISQQLEEVAIRNIALPKDANVFTGPINLQASFRAAGNGNQRNYEIVVSNNEGEKLTLQGRAEVDSWKQVPVAARAINPGSVLEALDFGLARLNSRDLPKDVALNSDELVGKMLRRDVAVGQVFRVGHLERPAVIKSGARVSLIFRSGTLEASASGIAMQDGFNGDIIEVKNDSSHRIVSGRIKDQSTVEILQ